MGNISDTSATPQGTFDPYLTAQTHLALERAPYQLRKHLDLPSIKAYRSELPSGSGTVDAANHIAGVQEGNTRDIQVYRPDAYAAGNDAINNDHSSQLAAHEGMHIVQNMLPAEMSNKFPAIDAKDPYADMRLTASDLVKARANGDTLWNHSREGQSSLIQKYQARQNWLNNPKTSPQDRSDYTNSTGQFEGNGNAEWQKAYGPYLDDLDSLQLPKGSPDGSLSQTPMPSLALPVFHAVHVLDGHPSQDGKIPNPASSKFIDPVPVPNATTSKFVDPAPLSTAPVGIDMSHVWGSVPGMPSTPPSGADMPHPMSGASALFHLPDNESGTGADTDGLNPKQRQYLSLKDQAQKSNSPDDWKRLNDFQANSGITLNERQDAAGANAMPFDVLHGIGQTALGAANLVATPNAKGNIPEASAAGTQILNGLMEAGSPFLPVGIAKAPLESLAGLGAGTITSAVAGDAAAENGADPRTQQFLRAAGFFVPTAVGLGAGLLKTGGPEVVGPESTGSLEAPTNTVDAQWSPVSAQAEAHLSAQGDSLPPQTGIAGMMSPETERISAQAAAAPHPLDQKIAAVEPGFEPTPEEIAAEEAQIIQSNAVPGFENFSDTDRANAARIRLKHQDAQNAITIHAMDTSGVPELQMAAHAQAANANPRVGNWVRHLAGEDTPLNSPASLPPLENAFVPNPDASYPGEPTERSAGTTQTNPIAGYRTANPDLTAKEAEMQPVLNKIARINTFLRSDNPDYSAANTEDITGQRIERLAPQHLTKTEAARLQELTGRRTKTNGPIPAVSSAPVAASPMDAKTATKQYLEDNDLKPAFQKEIRRKFGIAYKNLSPTDPDYGLLLSNYAKQNWFPIAKDLVEQHQALQGPKPETNPDELRELLGEGQLTAQTRQEAGIPQRSANERQEISNLRKKMIAKEGQKLTGLVRSKYLPEWKQELANGGTSSFNENGLDGLPTRLKKELLKEIPDAQKPPTTPTSQAARRFRVPKSASPTAAPETATAAATSGPEKGLEVAPLPKDLAGSKPRYGYQDKQFELQFSDPRDLAAYTIAQKTPNKAHARFLAYLREAYPHETDQQLVERGQGVRASIKTLAAKGNPDTGPLRIPAQTRAPEEWEAVQPEEGLNPRDETPPSGANGDKTPPPTGGEPLQFNLDNTPFHDTMDAVNNLINAHPESERWLQPMLEASIRAHSQTEAQVAAFRAGVKAYHEALDNADPFALKVGMDAARPSMRFGTKPYTPEELQAINSSVAEAKLKKLGSLAPLELSAHKEEIWSENLQGLIDESGDPDLAKALKELKARVPKTNSVTNAILGLFRDSLPKQQVDDLHSIIRSNSGKAYRNNVVLQKHLSAFDSLLNELSKAESLRFIARMEGGEAQVPDIFNALDEKTKAKWLKKYGETSLPHPDEVAGEMRRLLDLYKDNVNRSSGALENFYTNYMPHIFENFVKAQAFAKQWVAKTPLEGTTSYLKQRHYAFLEDAVMAGNMPLTFNPVRLGLMRMEQMGRFSMAHDIRNQMIEKQIARPFKMNDTKPEGWVPLEDKLFAIKQFVPEQGGIINRGQYYAPEAVAKDFNEFIKSGATGKWVVPYTNLSLFDAARGWAGLANRFQLSISILHGMETTLNADASELGDALVRGSYGDYMGAAKGVLNWASIFGPVIRNTYYGHHVMANFQDSTKALNYASMANAAEAAGVRFNLDPFLETHELEKMKVNWGKVTSDLPLSDKVAPLFKLPFNIAGAAIEKTTWPLMNWFIPRAKLGAFAMEMKRTQDLNPGASQEFLNREAEKAWDSMDDRFGEFVNSNWFVPQAMKDTLNLLFRSPGWNVGTARQGVGGLVDLAKALRDAPSKKARVRLSSRTAFMIALPMTVAYLNALYQKFHTNTFPSTPTDYFFPQTGTKNRDGEPNRVMPKSYVGDVINFYHDPTMSLFHKAAPEISTLSDIIRNSNYYGREVYDPASNGLSKFGQMALFAVQNSSTPFSVSNYAERKMRSPESQIFGKAGLESSLGYLPAPAWVGKTDAENLASQYYTMENPQGIKDDAEMDQKQTFVKLRQKALAGQITADQITQAMKAGKLKPGQIRYLFRAQNQTALEYHTERLNSMDRKMAIYQSATPEEKQKLLPILTRGLATVGPEQQQKDMKILGLQ